jgi:cob(I)alamin adenosyltransferase
MRIYTKTGDSGETSLFNGSRVKKNNLRIVTYGIVDETNSNIGLLICYLKQEKIFSEIEELLLKIQSQLFILGSDLANPNENLKDYPRIDNNDVTFIENTIDKYEKSLEPLKSFILPGGSIESSYCHIIRTVIRRSEVNLTDLMINEKINKICLIYLNRLSDLFFVLARVINKLKGISDIQWKPIAK